MQCESIYAARCERRCDFALLAGCLTVKGLPLDLACEPWLRYRRSVYEAGFWAACGGDARVASSSEHALEVEEPMAVGKVKWFNDEKGWGFIKQDNGPDVFVHYSQINGEGRRRLFEDETVEFEIKEGPKGLQAVNVNRSGGAMEAAN